MTAQPVSLERVSDERLRQFARTHVRHEGNRSNTTLPSEELASVANELLALRASEPVGGPGDEPSITDKFGVTAQMNRKLGFIRVFDTKGNDYATGPTGLMHHMYQSCEDKPYALTRSEPLGAQMVEALEEAAELIESMTVGSQDLVDTLRTIARGQS